MAAFSTYAIRQGHAHSDEQPLRKLRRINRTSVSREVGPCGERRLVLCDLFLNVNRAMDSRPLIAPGFTAPALVGYSVHLNHACRLNLVSAYGSVKTATVIPLNECGYGARQVSGLARTRLTTLNVCSENSLL
jgi:hypothetical protein